MFIHNKCIISGSRAITPSKIPPPNPKPNPNPNRNPNANRGGEGGNVPWGQLSGRHNFRSIISKRLRTKFHIFSGP